MTTDAQNPAVDALSEHLRAVMAAATLEAKPFYYLTTHDVFPADLYDEIQRCLPPTESYVPMNAAVNGHTNCSMRKHLLRSFQIRCSRL